LGFYSFTSFKLKNYFPLPLINYLNFQTCQISTNDNSTVTDSFLPSASQLRSIEIRKPRNELPSTGQRQKPGDGLGSRRPSPDRRSLMFCDGGGSGSLSERSRR